MGTTLGSLTVCLQPGPRASFQPLDLPGKGCGQRGPFSSRLRFWVGYMGGGWRVLWLSNVDA